VWGIYITNGKKKREETFKVRKGLKKTGQTAKKTLTEVGEGGMV